MRKVAIIIQKLHGGGAERTASNLSTLLSNECDVHLIVFDASKISYPIKGTLHNLDLKPRSGVIGKIITVFKRCRMVKKIKKDNNIDISISLMAGANLVNVLSRQKDFVVTSVRNQMSKSRASNGKIKRYDYYLMRFIGKHSDRIISLSDGVKHDLVTNFGINDKVITTIYNPCDVDLLREQSTKAGSSNIQGIDKQKSIVTMGRLNIQKGQWHLIRSFSQVVKKRPDAKLLIFGEGELRNKLECLTKELGISQSVCFMGFQQAPHRFLMGCRAFVFPSLYEGLGNVLLEAMAFSLPCISSDCYSGPREILVPGTRVQEHFDEIIYGEYGVLVSVCDGQHFNSEDDLTKEERQLADAMLTLLNEDSVYSKYCKKSEERVKSFFPERIKQDWINMFETLENRS